MTRHQNTDPAALPDFSDLPLFANGDTTATAAPHDEPAAAEEMAQRPAARNLAGATPTKPAPTTTDPVPAPAAVSTPPVEQEPPSAKPVPEPAEHQPLAPIAPAPVPSRLGDREGVDWNLVHRLRLEVASQIAEQLDTGERISKAAHEADALRIITRWLENNENRRVQIGEAPLGPRLRDKVTAAVLDSTFGLGRIEPLLRPEVEDISVRGCDNVLVSLADGRVEVHAPVAESDQELTRDIQHFAANSPFGERSFSPAHPILEMPLPDGSRLAAAGFSISPRPILTIRRNRLSDIELADLVDLGSITPGIREFLTAAVRSGKNVVVSGLPAAGKTTMIRAMLNTLDKTVPLATIETEYELHLHELTHRHQNVVALQTRGGGEDGTGEVTLADLVRAALRHSVEILVVGEVRSWEILDMLAAMRAGKGSVSTVHAKTPIQTVDRLVECAMQAESAVTSESAYRQVASNLDLVVSLGVVDERPQGGRRHRFLQAIDAITLSEDARNHVAHTPIYAPGPDGRAIPTGNRPEWLEDLERWGFDPGWLSPQNAGWSTPLDLIRPYRGRA